MAGTGISLAFARRLPPLLWAIALLNVGAWAWALIAFKDAPALLGLGLVIYGLGLRHAVDADHIAAIDNVVRKLMHEGREATSVGFFFALGHSAVVALVTVAVVRTATLLAKFTAFQAVGGQISTVVSALFLFSVAGANALVFTSVYRRYRDLRRGDRISGGGELQFGGGLIVRLVRPLFGVVGRSWHMLLLGFLFGLGFDTATEVAMFGLSAAQAAKGAGVGRVLAFPALFAAGMSLLDTADGLMMAKAYGWAFLKPMRKLYYNMTLTLVSVAAGLGVGGIEAVGLIRDRFGLKNGGWAVVEMLDRNLNTLGFALVGVFVMAWALSYAAYRLHRSGGARTSVAAPP